MLEEKYDVLDEEGNKTGVVLTKSEVHERELLHASVFIWIYNRKGEVLLQYRAADKKSFPNVWDVSVAGHISAGDVPRETAIREIKEEIGLNVQPDDLLEIERTSDVVPWLPNKKHPEVCWVYILHKELDPELLSIQQDELTAVKLESIDTIQSDRKSEDSGRMYAERNPRIYDIAFAEIRRQLQKV